VCAIGLGLNIDITFRWNGLIPIVLYYNILCSRRPVTVARRVTCLGLSRGGVSDLLSPRQPSFLPIQYYRYRNNIRVPYLIESRLDQPTSNNDTAYNIIKRWTRASQGWLGGVPGVLKREGGCSLAREWRPQRRKKITKTYRHKRTICIITVRIWMQHEKKKIQIWSISNNLQFCRLTAQP